MKELQNDTAIMIDVREESEFKLENIPIKNIFYFPMSGIVDQLRNIPTGKPVIVICNAGIRSLKVTNWLNLKGIHNSVNLDGGIIVWKAMGLPVGPGFSNENNFSESRL